MTIQQTINIGVPLNTKAPNLPVAPQQYSAEFQNEFENVLRLYFNTLDSNNRATALASQAAYSSNVLVWLGIS